MNIVCVFYYVMSFGIILINTSIGAMEKEELPKDMVIVETLDDTTLTYLHEAIAMTIPIKQEAKIVRKIMYELNRIVVRDNHQTRIIMEVQNNEELSVNLSSAIRRYGYGNFDDLAYTLNLFCRKHSGNNSMANFNVAFRSYKLNSKELGKKGDFELNHIFHNFFLDLLYGLHCYMNSKKYTIKCNLFQEMRGKPLFTVQEQEEMQNKISGLSDLNFVPMMRFIGFLRKHNKKYATTVNQGEQKRLEYEATVIKQVVDILSQIRRDNEPSYNLVEKVYAIANAVDKYPLLFNDKEYTTSSALKILHDIRYASRKKKFELLSSNGFEYMLGLTEAIRDYFDTEDYEIKSDRYQQSTQKQLFMPERIQEIKEIVTTAKNFSLQLVSLYQKEEKLKSELIELEHQIEKEAENI